MTTLFGEVIGSHKALVAIELVILDREVPEFGLTTGIFPVVEAVVVAAVLILLIKSSLLKILPLRKCIRKGTKTTRKGS